MMNVLERTLKTKDFLSCQWLAAFIIREVYRGSGSAGWRQPEQKAGNSSLL